MPASDAGGLDRDKAISTIGLTRSFGNAVAVDGLDMQVSTGEIYGFLGPNGAGKTTTLRVLCTLLGPSAGTAVVAGHDVVAHPDRVRLRIGVALQDVSLDPKQTGVELLHLQGRLYGLTRAQIEERIGHLSTLTDIGDALDRPIDSYSGGMRRRLDLAAALVHNPEVLFLDEPTTGLDPLSRARVWEEVRRLNHDLGMTIFLTTQYLEEADELADRIGIIDGGRLVAEGRPDDLKRSIGTDVIIARVDGDATAARAVLVEVAGIQAIETRGDELLITAAHGPSTIGPVAVALNQGAVYLRDLTLRTPTLDDVFLELTGSRIKTGDTSGRADTVEATA